MKDALRDLEFKSAVDLGSCAHQVMIKICGSRIHSGKERAMQSGIREVFDWEGEQFCFDLCSKSELWGAEEMRQWWMPVTELYAQREQKHTAQQNHLSIANFYWMMCRAESAIGNRDAQERFLLTRLLPRMRSQGSRTIFADAFLRKKLQKASKSQISALDELLSNSLDKELTRFEFHAKSLKSLGRPEIPARVQATYDDIVNTLLGRACEALEKGEVDRALAMVETQWLQFEKSILRRPGNFDLKLALDMLSYEARAAIHHCYAVAWCALLPRLNERHRLSRLEFDFHHFWHFDQIDEALASRGTCLSLFHGHVLALHPGISPFLQAPSGQLLTIHWLSHQQSEQAFRRLLHGLYVSIVQYSMERESVSDKRRRRVNLVNLDVVVEEESQAEKKQVDDEDRAFRPKP